MEGRLKARPPGTIPNTLGRQVGVLPISGSNKSRRKTSGSGQIGGTDITSPEYGASRLQGGPATDSASSIGSVSRNLSSRTKRESGSGTKRSPKGSTGRTTDQKDLNSQLQSGTHGRSPSNSLPASSRSSISTTKSPSSRTTTDSARNMSAVGTENRQITSGSSRRALGSSSSPTKPSRKGSRRDLTPDDDDNMVGQEINFINVPSSRSRPGSKVKKGSEASTPEKGTDIGRKPYRTIDPEEILAQNMESDFNKIYDINLHACEITTIENMDKFKKVKVLDLSCNYINQIKNLEINKDLRELKLYDNRLTKIEGLENLKELSSLQLQHNKIKSIGKTLTNLKKLKNLRIDCNQLLKIETFEMSPCAQLTVVDISYNMLDSLAALNYLPNLEELNASGNRLRSVSDLSKCKHLMEIDLSRNRITDLSGLRGLPKLLTLNISHNHLTSVKSMGRLKLLQDLFATNNQIHELSTVPTQLPALEVLDLTHNEITDWDEFYYLEEMTELVELFISGNPFCAQQGQMPHYFSAIQEVLPNLEIIDGAHIKKQVAKGAPLMRPMSASSIVSLRQMDTQMRSADEQMHSLEKSLEEKFASLRATCDSLPAEPPNSSQGLFNGLSDLSGSRPPSSSCSSRSRILEARKFASLRATCDSLPAEPPNSSRGLFSGLSDLSGSRPPSSSCSSRSRILEARKFAASIDLE